MSLMWFGSPGRTRRATAIPLGAVAAMAVLVQCGGREPSARAVIALDEGPAAAAGATLALAPCRPARILAEVRCGTLEVFENRDARSGRRLALDVVVLPSRRDVPAPDPIFFVMGGPGQSATQHAGMLWQSPLRDDREIVLVDMRGAGGSHALECVLAGSDDDIQGYFDPIFHAARFETCRRKLEQRADLRWYTTAAAVDDLDDARAALGYERINLVGRSYGTRAILIYARRRPARARAAFLVGIAPTALRNPLYHARAAQDALERLLAACELDVACHRAFPRIRQELDSVVSRLDREPATVALRHPATGAPVEIRLSRVAFAEALRVMMYRTESAMRVPLLIHLAYGGDFVPFAELGLTSNRRLRGDLRMGLLMSVVCSEDVPRIAEADIVRETRGTLLGDSRVREQMAACAAWPKGVLPDGHAEPVAVQVPMLLVTGSLDPVTPPEWGEEAARHLPNSVHLVMPGGHGVASRCLDTIAAEFLDRGSVAGLDTSCMQSLGLPPFAVR